MEVGRRLLELAKRSNAEGDYNKAFELYFAAFEKHIDLIPEVRDEFYNNLMKLNEVLMSADKCDDIFHNFSKALEVYPRNVMIVNDLGKYFYKYGLYTDAMKEFIKALKIKPWYVDAERNLNSMKNILVERWHYRMLNDKRRNDAYYEAIKMGINGAFHSVLDIGTGTGILAMFARDSGASTVTGVEASEPMAWIAENVTQGNDKRDIVIVNKMSTTLNYRDIGGKRSIIVTEIFDAGLFGEHALQTLSHAWEYFSVPHTRIIPCKAEFFVAAANCGSLNRKYQLGSRAKLFLNIQDLNVHVTCADNETYDSEDVHLLSDVTYMSDPQSVVSVIFNDYRDILEKINYKEPITIQYTAKADGEVNIYIGWFSLCLINNIFLTTDPTSDERANAWQQAVFFDNIPMPLKKNERYSINFLLNSGKLTLFNESAPSIHRISPEMIRFLNDEEYIEMIRGTIGIATIYLGQMASISDIDIVDLCPFPIFGLLMMKHGVQSLVCYAKTESDKHFIKKVFEGNNVSWSLVTVMVGEQWGIEDFHNQKYHAVFSHILDMCGDVEKNLSDIGYKLKEKHLVPGGLFLPACIQLIVQIVYSEWIDINNKVFNSNVRDYKVAQHINQFGVTQNFCIDLNNLKYVACTEPTNLGCLDRSTGREEIDIQIVNDSKANAILCWYNVELMPGLETISTKRTKSFTDGMLFYINPEDKIQRSTKASISRCIDSDRSFKLVFEGISA